ncbi:hypothetical protein FPOAC2_07005 [Fusarium poae]|uniref:hypothetical protein n=1 Tax=Fusarium poae TaxID=36050 RepID=UPI001CEBEB4A|nr:hypothetical protein FPOAC1_006873 [Fusarium poae]KAG8673559.1 hypothetical protein FPOAC1_006873 [Fusarium poae]
MDSTNLPTQVAQAGGQKQPEPRSLMLNVHIYDNSSIQERLLNGAAATTNPPGTVDDTVAGDTRLQVLEDQIIDFDLIMGTSSSILSRL